ncbi:hypothetical protein Scep_012282 [Stephania cephalantha]|uniref:Uncharacterized protein n=1 Tax=Stephania cephalantha TaxID=152367 RepID=A0AAP0JEW3_9MAGN
MSEAFQKKQEDYLIDNGTDVFINGLLVRVLDLIGMFKLKLGNSNFGLSLEVGVLCDEVGLLCELSGATMICKRVYLSDWIYYESTAKNPQDLIRLTENLQPVLISTCAWVA